MDEKVEIRWVEETDSTQDEVRRHISEYDNLSVVAAEFQKAGRGQRGNTWLAMKGENLTFSMLLKFGEKGFPSLKASEQFLITKAATVGVTDYLGSKSISCSIKWPNDIYFRDKKICGMLIENILDKEYLAFSVVGIGLNVNQREFPPQLMNPTSMSAITGKTYDIKEELDLLADYLASAFKATLGSDNEFEADHEYVRRLYRKDEFHEFTICQDGSLLEGKIIGVTPGGLVQIMNRKGELFQFAFKEISYII
ncbi:MAG: biotin--[Bacteroidales bacterium]|nr:biotin--[acetyl-CoA-carboxylase] ligase [Bacteroidales bacterium]